MLAKFRSTISEWYRMEKTLHDMPLPDAHTKYAQENDDEVNVNAFCRSNLMLHLSE